MFDGVGPLLDDVAPPARDLAILRAALLFLAALQPTTVAAAVGLALWQGWSWWEWTIAGFAAFWSAPLAWCAWATARLPDARRSPR